MGQMAEDILDGMYCQHCGQLMIEPGDPIPGYPQSCCEED